jgi:Leucine-rich repeat (LRR) protein
MFHQNIVLPKKLNIIEENSFIDLEKLNTLNLSFNDITKLNKNIFINNINLLRLNLSNNNIIEIEENIFINLRVHKTVS